MKKIFATLIIASLLVAPISAFVTENVAELPPLVLTTVIEFDPETVLQLLPELDWSKKKSTPKTLSLAPCRLASILNFAISASSSLSSTLNATAESVILPWYAMPLNDTSLMTGMMVSLDTAIVIGNSRDCVESPAVEPPASFTVRIVV